jgi:hypothetical protein
MDSHIFWKMSFGPGAVMRGGGIVVLGIVGLIALASCGRLGPTSVVRDRFNYSAAISESWKNQMLQNIVKARYADLPVFLEVTSVVAQYELEGRVLATTRPYSGNAPSQAPLSVGGSYSERPTISYKPLTGEKFIKGLMTPLPPEIILHLIEAGWPAEFILGLAVQAINGIYNRAGGQMVRHPADPEFDSLLRLLASIQGSGALAMGLQRHDGNEEVVLMFREHPDLQVQSDVASLMQLLRLDPDTHRFTVVAGICPEGDNEVALQARSILMIMEELAMGVEVPSAHIAETIHAMDDSADTTVEAKSHVRILSGAQQPDDAFAAIQYRGYWFWIENRDLQSKRAFSFIQILMTLSEGGDSGGSPVLTLPTG